jgi:alpha-glucosidase
LIHWIGDQEATWAPEDGLPTVVPAMINLGLVGVPFVTHDIAGFSGGPSSKELYLRWSELGAFTPVMRTHEGDNRDSNWRWNSDEETVAHVRRFSRVHEALAPHMARWAREAAVSSMPLVQHMMLAFPEDEATWSLSDQYMLGGELLVAPVVSQGATSRELYLPEGDWVHVWTGETYAGGRTLTVDAPVGAPPVFGRGQDWAELRAVE